MLPSGAHSLSIQPASVSLIIQDVDGQVETTEVHIPTPFINCDLKQITSLSLGFLICKKEGQQWLSLEMGVQTWHTAQPRIWVPVACDGWGEEDWGGMELHQSEVSLTHTHPSQHNFPLILRG